MARREMPSAAISKSLFITRFKTAFSDPCFLPLTAEVGRIADAAWDAYEDSRKSPLTRRAGPEFHDPDYDLSVDWLAARDAIRNAKRQFEDPGRPWEVLVVNSSPRSENTCPGESSKTWRLAKIAEQELTECGFEVRILDLSRIASEYGRTIHPCKACFSTAAPLCHWPCSCYPNYSLGQTHDWMNEIYPMWVAAHGILIITPVHWYQAPSVLKLMMDRLVCADGGNPDPTRTHGKDADLAKRIETAGWDYPQHLAGRLFGVIAHGDTEGAENVRRAISDWLRSIGLISAGGKAELDRYIGYWKPYATSHNDLDRDKPLQQEVRNVARVLALALQRRREGDFRSPDPYVTEARKK